MNPKISIIAPAFRPQLWMDLYKSIGDNQVDFELVFVGPNTPDYKLPKNFRFIRSLVKPPQCFEIAVRNAVSGLIMTMADDCEFITPHPLDKVYNLYRSCNSDKVIVSSRMMTNGVDQSHFAHRFFIDDESSPLMPLAGLMSKKLHNDLGGVDKNFIAVMWPLDIAMRNYASGGKVVMSDVYLNEDTSKRMGSNLCSEFWQHDRILLESLWTTDGRVHFNRSKPVAPFSDKNILSASQGPRGRWRGRYPLFIERTGDGAAWLGSIFARINRGIRRPSMYLDYAKRISLHMKRRFSEN